MSFRKVGINAEDLATFDNCVMALFRACENTLALALAARILRMRGEFMAQELMCDADESAGLAEVVELHGHSKRVTTERSST